MAALRTTGRPATLPDLNFYVAHPHAKAEPKTLERIAQHHPRLHKKSPDIVRTTPFHLSDAQLVIAREHGFESWPKFARHVEELRLSREVASLDDPGSQFIEAACSPRHGHRTGTLEEAEIDRKSTRLNSSHLGISYA